MSALPARESDWPKRPGWERVGPVIGLSTRRVGGTVPVMAKISATVLTAVAALRRGDLDTVTAAGDIDLPAKLGGRPVVSPDIGPEALATIEAHLGHRQLVALAEKSTRADTRLALLGTRYASVWAAALHNYRITREEVAHFCRTHTADQITVTVSEALTSAGVRTRCDDVVGLCRDEHLLRSIRILVDDDELGEMAEQMPRLAAYLVDYFENGGKDEWLPEGRGIHTEKLLRIIRPVVDADWAKAQANRLEVISAEAKKPIPKGILLELWMSRDDVGDHIWAQRALELGAGMGANHALTLFREAGRLGEDGKPSRSAGEGARAWIEEAGDTIRPWSSTAAHVIVALAGVAPLDQSVLLSRDSLDWLLEEHCDLIPDEYLHRILEENPIFVRAKMVEDLVAARGEAFTKYRLQATANRIYGYSYGDAIPHEVVAAALSSEVKSRPDATQVISNLSHYAEAHPEEFKQAALHCPLPYLMELANMTNWPAVAEYVSELLADVAAQCEKGAYFALLDSWEGTPAELVEMVGRGEEAA